MNQKAPVKPKTQVPFWSMEVNSLFISGGKRGKTTARGYAMFAEHAHQHYEMVFNFSAIPIRHTVSGRTYETDTPYILFRAPYVLHSLNTLTDQPYIRTQVSFHPCMLSRYSEICDLGRLRGRQECMLPVTEKQLAPLEQLLTHMQKMRKKAASEKAQVSLLAVLLYEVSELIPDDLPYTPSQPYIQELMHYIVEHTDEDLTAPALAKKFFVGKTKLAADFTAATQLSLHEYVTAIRISRAKSWLAEGVPLGIIADRCGYSQDSSFIYMFRRETGMTPGEWREKLHQ